jgi:hypothetical protein
MIMAVSRERPCSSKPATTLAVFEPAAACVAACHDDFGTGGGGGNHSIIVGHGYEPQSAASGHQKDG